MDPSTAGPNFGCSVPIGSVPKSIHFGAATAFGVPIRTTACPRGHPLHWQPIPPGGTATCDQAFCGKVISVIESNTFMSFSCRACNYDLCPHCVLKQY